MRSRQFGLGLRNPSSVAVRKTSDDAAAKKSAKKSLVKPKGVESIQASSLCLPRKPKSLDRRPSLRSLKRNPHEAAKGDFPFARNDM
jgi:hypothetical protein